MEFGMPADCSGQCQGSGGARRRHRHL
jgi:hypothetical protein